MATVLLIEIKPMTFQVRPKSDRLMLTRVRVEQAGQPGGDRAGTSGRSLASRIRAGLGRGSQT
jgi:hypothetical protein